MIELDPNSANSIIYNAHTIYKDIKNIKVMCNYYNYSISTSFCSYATDNNYFELLI